MSTTLHTYNNKNHICLPLQHSAYSLLHQVILSCITDLSCITIRNMVRNSSSMPPYSSALLLCKLRVISNSSHSLCTMHRQHLLPWPILSHSISLSSQSFHSRSNNNHIHRTSTLPQTHFTEHTSQLSTN